MKRKLLFIALDFPPLNSSGTYRNTKFVKYLGRFGWQPVVVTLDWERHGGDDPLDHSMLREIPEQTPIIRLPHFNPVFHIYDLLARLRHRSDVPSDPTLLAEVVEDAQPRGRLYTGVRNLYHAALTPLGDTFFYWSLRVLPECIEVAQNHQAAAIYVSVPPWTPAILGVLLKPILRLPLIVDFRDYWTMWAVKKEDARRDSLNAHVERWILRHADRVTCVHQAMADDFERLEPRCAGQCRVITNGYDADDFQRRADVRLAPPGRTEVHPPSTQLTHTGIARGDSALPLLKALAQLKRENIENRLRVNFIGGLPPSAQQFVQDQQLNDWVRIEKRVPHHEAIERMRQADVLLLLLVGNEGGRKWYPGKIFEYLYMGRPVLAVAPNGIATKLISEAGVGLAVEPHDTEQLVKILREMTTSAPSFHQNYYRPNGRVIAQFDRVALTRKLASVLDEVCRARLE